MDKHLFTQVLIHFFIAVRETHQSRFQTPLVRFARWIAGAKISHSSACKTLVSNCPTSAEKLLDFTAEVGEVLSCVFSIPPARILHRTLRI